MNIETMKRVHRLQTIIHLFESQVQRRWRTREIAERLGINEDTANKYLNELQVTGLLPLTKEGLYWFLPEGAVIPRLQLSLSYPEAVGLYLAGRLLAQTRDERNWHLTMALHKLVEALPAPVREQQETIAALLLTEDSEREDFSAIFLALACGWVQHRRIRLIYEPPRKNRFETLFDPYLLEPSAIGRTIYVLGYSHTVRSLRTLKLERIRHAELTSEAFVPDPSFKAEELLQRAWGVMYGDEEPVRVRLHFSSQVVKRVRETRWHPSQEIRLTRDGCEWTALIGDLVEIEPWVRGWGADCVVLEPEELRQRVISHVQRASQNYGLQPAPLSTHEPGRLNADLFRRPTRPEEA